MARKRDSPENETKRDLSIIFGRIIQSDGYITPYIIDKTIRALVDAPNSELTMTNYYKLRRYFIDGYGMDRKLRADKVNE